MVEQAVLTGTWEEFLKIIKEESGSRVVDTWFKAVSLRAWDSHANTAYLQAPNAFVRAIAERASS